MKFHTANGSVDVESVSDEFIGVLKDTVSPYVLDDCPAVISLGRRCVQTMELPMGCLFYALDLT